MEEKRKRILALILLERKRQNLLHPQIHDTKAEQLMVLVEEVGEVATAIQDKDKDNENYIEELIQVASYAVRMLEQTKI